MAELAGSEVLDLGKAGWLWAGDPCLPPPGPSGLGHRGSTGLVGMEAAPRFCLSFFFFLIRERSFELRLALGCKLTAQSPLLLSITGHVAFAFTLLPDVLPSRTL